MFKITSEELPAKRVIHIDQHIASNIAKDLEEGSGTINTELFRILSSLVDENLVICPISYSHTIESSFDTRLEPGVLHIMNRLSRNLQFFGSTRIMNAQLRCIMKDYLGVENEIKLMDWQNAFLSHPRLKLLPGRDYQPTTIPYYYPDRYLAKKSRNEYLEFSENVWKKHVKNGPHTFDGWYKREVETQIVSYYGTGLDRLEVALKNLSIKDLIDVTVQDMYRFWDLFLQQSSNFAEFRKFFKFEQLRKVPYIDVSSMIYAKIVSSSSNRPPARSDNLDVITLATVIPYCDIVTTDNFMSVLCRELMKDVEPYKNVKFYGGKKKDKQELLELVRGLQIDT